MTTAEDPGGERSEAPRDDTTTHRDDDAPEDSVPSDTSTCTDGARPGDSLRVEKFHGTDNDFVVVPAGSAPPDPGRFAAVHCDRETGIGADRPGRTGADGLLVLDLEAAAVPPRVGMTLYQPDGGTAAMCGNGARCVAAWAHRRCGAREVVIETGAGDRRARVESVEGGDPTVTVEMGVPSFDAPGLVDPDRAPVPLWETAVEGLTVSAVDTGVPHAVAFVDDVDAVELEAVAPPVRHAAVFPDGANVTLAHPTDRGFAQRTFERGVEGETRACGTGAVAIAAVARRLGLLDAGETTVSPPGGELRVTVPEGGPATLAGPARFEYATTLRVPADDAEGGRDR